MLQVFEKMKFKLEKYRGYEKDRLIYIFKYCNCNFSCRLYISTSYKKVTINSKNSIVIDAYKYVSSNLER